MAIWVELPKALKRISADITAIVNRVLFLENITVHGALDVNTEYSDKDNVTGKFRTIVNKRLDGTILRKTVYEIDPDVQAEIPPKLNLKIVTLFAKDGIEILDEVRYRVAYDSEGDITSETVLSE